VVVPQLEPTPGMPQRMAVERRKSRVISILHTLPRPAQQAILASLSTADLERYRQASAPTRPQASPPPAPASPPPAPASPPVEPNQGGRT
jgi:phospholipid/cholesterol/gamma-HCH transport system ATP-binding protein